MRITQKLIIAAAIGALSFTAGCSSDATTDAATDATATPAVTSAAASSAATPTTAASATASPATSATVPPAADAAAGCPVSATTLLAVFKASDMYADAAKPKALENVACYGGYAVARTVVEMVDPAGVLFKYDVTKQTWVAVNFGTAGFCAGRVPADIQAALKGCN